MDIATTGGLGAIASLTFKEAVKKAKAVTGEVDKKVKLHKPSIYGHLKGFENL